MSAFEHQFLVKVREAMEEKAKQLGVEIQFVEAQGDIGKQLNQIQNFITQKMDAIIVNPVDTTATPKMTQLVTEAKIPLVYVNLQPAEETLPKGAAYVGSPEITSGKLQGEAIAKLLNNKGNVVLMVGELATQAAILRTEGVEKVVAQHPEMKIVGKQTANWRRNEAIDLIPASVAWPSFLDQDIENVIDCYGLAQNIVSLPCPAFSSDPTRRFTSVPSLLRTGAG